MAIGLVLCAGRGVRLKEETRDRPKCMADVAGKPILEHIADHMNKHGIWRIVVNLHAFPEVVMKHFGQRFLYLYEPMPMGEFATMGIIKHWFPGEDILCVNGDTLTDFFPGEVGNMTARIECPPKLHNGYTLYKDDGEVIKYYEDNDRFFDIGTPEKLKIAREYYASKNI